MSGVVKKIKNVIFFFLEMIRWNEKIHHQIQNALPLGDAANLAQWWTARVIGRCGCVAVVAMGWSRGGNRGLGFRLDLVPSVMQCKSVWCPSAVGNGRDSGALA